MRIEAFLPQDRRAALAAGTELPELAYGAALFVDLAGFTALTERLAASLGALQGAEELGRVLAAAYHDLIGPVEEHGGSVIGFAGDAITCWFEGDDGRRAVSAATQVQRGVAARGAHRLPGGGSARLGAKASVAVGAARRFAVGDPAVQRIDLIAGATLERLAAAEHVAREGEVVIALSPDARAFELAEIRPAAMPGLQVGVVRQAAAQLLSEREPAASARLGLPAALAAPWVLAPLRAQVAGGAGTYLAGFRPAAALFQSFGGIDFDHDPEAGAKLDAYVRWVQGVVTEAGGTLVQLTMGDKGSYLFAAFGAPSSHHDDAVRAVAVARELVRPPFPGIVDVRIGITFGQMLVGAYGSENRCTYGVLGPGTNLAARLMGRAGPGSILCTEEVARLAAPGWRFRARGEVRVKGVAGAVPVFEPLTEVAGRPAPHGPPTGRAAERARLDEAVEAAARGASRVLALLGEAGSGKSRLLAYVAGKAQARGMAVAAGRGQAASGAGAYQPWREVVRDLLRLPRGAERADLHAALLAFGPHLAPRAELLEDVLWPERTTAERGGSERKELVSAAVQALVVAALERAPLLLLFDDLQWFDGLSAELLLLLREETAGRAAGLLVACAARPSEAGAAPEGLPPGALELAPMPAAELLELAAARLGVAVTDLPPTLREALTTRAGGNPFMVETLLDDLREQGALRVTGPARSLVMDAGSFAWDAVPVTVQGLVLARIDRLSSASQLTLKAGAVMGSEFQLPPLCSTLGQVAAMGDAQVVAEVKALGAGGFVDLDPGERLYRFRQPLTREVAYQSLLFSQRRAMHLRLAAWFRAQVPAQPSLIAHHAYHAALGSDDADLIAAAADDLLALADHQLALAAYRDVVSTCERALQLLADGGEWRERRVVLRLRLGVVYEHLSQYDVAEACLGLAMAEARAVGAARLVVDALNALCMVATRRGELEVAARYAREALGLSERAGYREGMARALSRSGILAAYGGEHERAAREYEAALGLARELNDLVSLASCLSNLALVRIYQERAEAAGQLLEEAMAVARRLGNRHLWARFVTNLGLAEERAGKLGPAEEHYRAGLAIFEELGARQEATVNVLNLGDLAMRSGEPAAARVAYDRALQGALELGAVPVALSAVGGLAWVAVRSGDPERAAELLGLTLGHPARDHEVEQHGAMVLEEVRGALAPGSLEEARRRGAGYSLEEVARSEADRGLASSG